MRMFKWAPHPNGPKGCSDTARITAFILAHEGEFVVEELENDSPEVEELRQVASLGDKAPMLVVFDTDDNTIVKGWVEPSDAALDEAHALVLAG